MSNLSHNKILYEKNRERAWNLSKYNKYVITLYGYTCAFKSLYTEEKKVIFPFFCLFNKCPRRHDGSSNVSS